MSSFSFFFFKLGLPFPFVLHQLKFPLMDKSVVYNLYGEVFVGVIAGCRVTTSARCV